MGFCRNFNLKDAADRAVDLMIAGALTMALTAIVGFFLAIPVYFLWNWLMPAVFGLPTITYWMAWGLYFLSTLLLSRAGNG